MAVGYNPRAITDGLVLALDAGNPKNYNAGISTNWTDKIGGNNGTLVGGTYHNDGPFVGAGYVEFDGTGDYLSITDSTDFDFGSGDFTIEFFLYSASFSDYTGILGKRNAETDYAPLLIDTDNSAQKKMRFLTSTTGSSWISITSSSAFPLSQWVHVAVVRSGSTITLYENGVSKGSASISGSIISNSVPVFVGAGVLTISGSARLNGFLSNLRILKGTALYTANFTPPTEPLTAVTNTVLLTCQGNTISPGTDIVVTTSNKGSGSVGSLSAVTSSGNYYFDNRSASPSTASIQLDFKTVQIGVTQIKLSGGSYALGSTFDLYVNGVLVEDDRSVVSAWGEDTITISSTNISSIKIEGSDGYSLGALKFNGTLVSGTISEIVPNGDISLTKEPFAGAGAVEFDGTGDYLTAGSASDWTFLNDGSTFTAECWFYSNSTSLQTLLSTAATQSAVGFFLSINDTATGDVAAGIYKGTTGVLKAGSSGSSWNTGTWNHVAVVCDPSLLTLYLNGVSVGTANAASFAFNGSNPAYTLAVGRYQLATPGGYVDGYISNVRFVNGTALYTSNFTPPAEPLTAVTNTELLTCQGQSIKDASSSAHAITVNGDAKATIVSSAFEFDGSNDYVDCGTSTDFDFGTGNYTIEAWIYINDGVQQYHGIFGSSGTGSDSFQFQLQDEKIRLSSYTTEILVSDAADVVPFTQWTHVAISRSGTGATDTKLYKNGSLIKSGQDNINWGSYSRQIGRVFSNNAYDLYGKIAQVKVYKGKGLTAAEVLQNYNATKGRYA